MTSKLLLAEGHELVAEGLRAILSAKYSVIGIVHDGAKVLAAMERYRSDVLLLDLSLPNRTRIDLIPEIHEAHPPVHILVVTMHTEAHLVEIALKMGAAGYVPKSACLKELETAIEEVLEGRHYVAPKLPRRSDSEGAAIRMWFDRLTPQQQRIVRMIGKGMRSKDIALRLGLSAWTVHYHRKSIRLKLGTHSGCIDMPFSSTWRMSPRC